MPSASITMNIGVISRLPFSVIHSLAPWHSLVAGSALSTHLIRRFSSNSSSSSAPSFASFTAV